MSSDHSYFEELAALSAGGYLSEEELREFREHASECAECRQSEADFRDIVCSGLPLTQRPIRTYYERLMYRPLEGARKRFLQQARLEGVRFSEKSERPHHSILSPVLYAAGIAGVSALATALAIFAIYPRFSPPSPAVTSQPPAQTDDLRRENAELKARLAAQPQPASSQNQNNEEIQILRGQLQAAITSAKSDAQDINQLRAQMLQEDAGRAQLLAEDQTREKLLEEAKAELARISQRGSEDQATTVAQRIRINDLSEQLRVANTSLSLERQMLAQGKDVRDLMGARQLHVVDVRDTDSTGKAGKAFGRVFLTEGKSLIFYAFDLNDSRTSDAKHAFQLWGQDAGKPGSVRSLGLLYADDKAQHRWALKVDDPGVVSEIDSVFVTVEPAGGGKKPSGQRILNAYLGEANHP